MTPVNDSCSRGWGHIRGMIGGPNGETSTYSSNPPIKQLGVQCSCEPLCHVFPTLTNKFRFCFLFRFENTRRKCDVCGLFSVFFVAVQISNPTFLKSLRNYICWNFLSIVSIRSIRITWDIFLISFLQYYPLRCERASTGWPACGSRYCWQYAARPAHPFFESLWPGSLHRKCTPDKQLSLWIH